MSQQSAEQPERANPAGFGEAAIAGVVGAALVSHVPTLVLPEQVRRELNEGEDTTLSRESLASEFKTARTMPAASVNA